MNILSLFGLMKRSEHEAAIKIHSDAVDEAQADALSASDKCRRMMNERNDIAGKHGALVLRLESAEAKYKKAIKEVADQAAIIQDLTVDRGQWRKDCLAAVEREEALLASAEQDAADAEKWRASLKRSRDRRANKGRVA